MTTPAQEQKTKRLTHASYLMAMIPTVQLLILLLVPGNPKWFKQHDWVFATSWLGASATGLVFALWGGSLRLKNSPLVHFAVGLHAAVIALFFVVGGIIALDG